LFYVSYVQAISLLVARYGSLATKGSVVREAIAKAIAAACGVDVHPDEIEVGEREVRVRLSGARRAALFLKREAAEAAASSVLGKPSGALR
jgi:hypothetical protein